jgi:hypothetical protein
MTAELRSLLSPSSAFAMFVVLLIGLATRNYIYFLTLLAYTGLVLVNKFPPYRTGEVLFWVMTLAVVVRAFLL